MTQEMVELDKKLSVNEKRNELSSLLVKLDYLVNQLMIKNKIDYNLFSSVKNYDSSKQALCKEEDILLFFYSDLWNLKNKVFSLMMLEEE